MANKPTMNKKLTALSKVTKTKATTPPVRGINLNKLKKGIIAKKGYGDIG